MRNLEPLRADPFSEGTWSAGKQTGSTKVVFLVKDGRKLIKLIHSS